MVCATSKGSDQPAHTRSLIRAFTRHLNILWLLGYWLNINWRFWAQKDATQPLLSQHLSTYHLVGNHMSRLSFYCVLAIVWLFAFCVSSLRCRGLVWRLRLGYFLVILTCWLKTFTICNNCCVWTIFECCCRNARPNTIVVQQVGNVVVDCSNTSNTVEDSVDHALT